MKKSLAFLITLLMTISVIAPVSQVAFAAESTGFKVNKPKYSYTQKKTVTEYSTKTINNTYDKCGRLVKAETVDKTSSGKNTETVENTFDKNGRISKVTSTYSDYPDANKTTIYSYNQNGDIIKRTVKLKSGEKYEHTYVYNKDGKISSVKIPGSYSLNYTYDKNGNIIKSVEKNSAEKTNTEKNYKYDNHNRLVSVKVKYYRNNSADNYTETRSYSYNKNGHISKIVSTSGYTYAYTYNENGTLKTATETITYGSDKYIYKNTYNKNGNIIEEKFTSNTGSSSSTVYSYDKNGNVIKRVHSTISDNSTRKFTDTMTYDSHSNLSKSVLNSSGIKETSTYKCAPNSTLHTLHTRPFISEILTPYELNYKDSYTYTGKAIKPQITVTALFTYEGEAYDSFSQNYDAMILLQGIDYTVRFKNNKNPGTGKIIIDFVDPEKDDITLNFTIKPDQVEGLKVTSTKSGTVKADWKTVPGVKYYKVEKSTDGKKWEKVKIVNTNSITVNSLKGGKSYKFRVTALDTTQKVSGKASAVKNVTVKK